MSSMKFWVAGSLIVGTVVFLVASGFNDAMVYYHTVPELEGKATELAGQPVRISGHVLDGSIVRNQDPSGVEFTVIDRPSGRQMVVAYNGIVPDTFKDGAEVVVEGTYAPENPPFEATLLLAKCPSKYERVDEEYSLDSRRIE